MNGLPALSERTVDILGRIAAERPDEVEKLLLSSAQSSCPVIHRFGPGQYIREVGVPAGTFAIGHHQNFPHMNVFLRGKVRIFREDGTTDILTAPMLFVGQPGRKVGYVLEDMVWLNIYATEETDIGKLEEHFLTKSEAALDFERRLALPTSVTSSDFALMLAEVGVTAEQCRVESENTSDQIPFPFGSYKVRVAPSSIEGQGLFATADIAEGETIAPGRLHGKRTPAGRYTNHSATPNAVVSLSTSGDVYLVAAKPISGSHGGQLGEEITLDYRHALQNSRGVELCQQ